MAKVYKYKTVPNQKVIKIKDKETCDKQHTYATFNLEALNHAMADLDAGAFKMWMYIDKNQDGYEFALSRKDCKDNFGISKSQYDTALKKLEEQGYLVCEGGNYYTFHEVPVITKKDNDVVLNQYHEDPQNNSVVSNQYHDVVLKENHVWQENDTRNNTNNTINNTDCVSLQTTFEVSRRCLSNSEDEGKEPEVEEVKEVKTEEEIQVDGTISKFDLQNVLHYEMIGENLVRFTTGKVFKVV